MEERGSSIMNIDNNTNSKVFVVCTFLIKFKFKTFVIWKGMCGCGLYGVDISSV